MESFHAPLKTLEVTQDLQVCTSSTLEKIIT